MLSCSCVHFDVSHAVGFIFMYRGWGGSTKSQHRSNSPPPKASFFLFDFILSNAVITSTSRSLSSFFGPRAADLPWARVSGGFSLPAPGLCQVTSNLVRKEPGASCHASVRLFLTIFDFPRLCRDRTRPLWSFPAVLRRPHSLPRYPIPSRPIPRLFTHSLNSFSPCGVLSDLLPIPPPLALPDYLFALSSSSFTDCLCSFQPQTHSFV